VDTALPKPLAELRGGTKRKGRDERKRKKEGKGKGVKKGEKGWND